MLSSCGGQAVSDVKEIQRLMPDTSKTWAGKTTNSEYQNTRNIERKFQLVSLLNGTKGQEFRLWIRAGNYDPQELHILREENGRWQLRQVSYYSSSNDSISSDIVKEVQASFVDSLQLHTLWKMPSQSQMVKGDSYGCMDGSDILLEMANRSKYRFAWYRCPNINKDKDSVFRFVSELTQKLIRQQFKR